MDEAKQTIQRGISMCEELKLKPFSAVGHLLLGELLADAGRKEEAVENLSKTEALFLDMKVTPKSYWLKRTKEALAKMG
jgi:hypothetical protein